MNWRVTYARIQILFTISVASAFSAVGCSAIIAGLCKVIFAIGENESLLYIGAPLFVILFAFFIKHLPEPLRKAGMLSDSPESFESSKNRDDV